MMKDVEKAIAELSSLIYELDHMRVVGGIGVFNKKIETIKNEIESGNKAKQVVELITIKRINLRRLSRLIEKHPEDKVLKYYNFWTRKEDQISSKDLALIKEYLFLNTKKETQNG